MTPSPRRTDGTRHWAGFVASGLIALFADAVVLWALTRGFDLSPFLARLVAIAVATVIGFLAHRSLTFDVTGSPTLSEFGRFVSVAWSSSAVNYAVFSIVLLAWPQMPPLLALFGATLVSMFVTYAGLRYGVFRQR
jgi:putative flippase GtrA